MSSEIAERCLAGLLDLEAQGLQNIQEQEVKKWALKFLAMADSPPVWALEVLYFKIQFVDQMIKKHCFGDEWSRLKYKVDELVRCSGEEIEKLQHYNSLKN